MPVPQTVQMTYWSHRHFLGATTVVKSLLRQKEKNIFSSLHHSFSLLFRVNIKVFQTTQWCLGAPATRISPSTILLFLRTMTPHLVPESLKWTLASSHPQSPSKKNTQVSFYSIDPCSTSTIFFGKKWGFHLIRFDHTKQTSSAASPGPNSLWDSPAKREVATRRWHSKSIPLKRWRFEGPRCSRETWPRKHQSQLNSMM